MKIIDEIRKTLNNQIIDNMIERFDYLYKLYEEYAWKHPNAKILISAQYKSIGLYISDSNGFEDQYTMSFSENEYLLYQYTVLALLAITLGNAYIYRDKNRLYNSPRRRSYVSMDVDDELLKIIIPILSNQDSEYIRKEMDYISRARSDIFNEKKKLYSTDFLDNMDSKIDRVKRKIRGVA